MTSYYARQEDDLVDQVNAGEITEAEFRQEMRELHRDHQQAAEEAAQAAYDREMERW